MTTGAGCSSQGGAGRAGAAHPHLGARVVREVRPDVGEVDIDFVVHGDDNGGALGPAVQFALDAQPGDRVGFLDQGVGFIPDHPHDWTLLVGDETALPAIAGICRSLPASAQGVAIIEAPGTDDRQEISAPTEVEVVWISRDAASRRTTRRVNWPSVHCRRRRCRRGTCTPISSVSPGSPPERGATSCRSGVCRSDTLISSATGVTGVQLRADCQPRSGCGDDGSPYVQQPCGVPVSV